MTKVTDRCPYCDRTTKLTTSQEYERANYVCPVHGIVLSKNSGSDYIFLRLIDGRIHGNYHGHDCNYKFLPMLESQLDYTKMRRIIKNVPGYVIGC